MGALLHMLYWALALLGATVLLAVLAIFALWTVLRIGLWLFPGKDNPTDDQPIDWR